MNICITRTCSGVNAALIINVRAILQAMAKAIVYLRDVAIRKVD